MIEVDRTRRGHAIFFGQENLRPQSANGARYLSDDDLVETVDHFIASEHQNRAAFVGKSKCVRANRRGSRLKRMELIPSLCIPGDRLIVHRELVAGRRRCCVRRSVVVAGRRDLPEQFDALTVGQRRRQRNYVVSG